MEGRILTKKNIVRLAITGIIIFGGIYVGSHSYIVYLQSFTREKVQVKDLSANITRAILNDFELTVGDEKLIIKAGELRDWTEKYIRDYSENEMTRIATEKVADYVRSLALLRNTEPVNAKFEIKNGKVAEFQPSMVGKVINISKATDAIISALMAGGNAAAINFEEKEPDISLEKINNLGINTLLGKGESNFSGSTAARIHNITVGVGRFNGLLIGPGEEFSFNTSLGDVEESTGYRYELVIKNGKVVPELGGGLCQVATTLFRSAIFSGLPIIERKPHSFPVHYYNPQGFDATIYPGITDLRFKNDTPNHALIQGRIQGNKLTFEIYGSSDGRKTVIDGPYQYDIRSSGTMKAYFIRKIYYGDELKNEEKFSSIYRAPPAKEKNPLE